MTGWSYPFSFLVLLLILSKRAGSANGCTSVSGEKTLAGVIEQKGIESRVESEELFP